MYLAQGLKGHWSGQGKSLTRQFMRWVVFPNTMGAPSDGESRGNGSLVILRQIVTRSSRSMTTLKSGASTGLIQKRWAVRPGGAIGTLG